MAENEYWGWGVKKFTPEEQAEYDKQWAAASGQQSAGNGQQTEEGYYSGTMAEAAAPVTVQPAEQPEAEPQPSKHWITNPQNFAEVWNKFDQDPELENDGHYFISLRP